MPLPNLEKMVPTFQVTIPSTKEEATFRPFLVKEEKLLLIALESNDEKAMLDAIVQAVKSCAISPIKVETLANFDLEYIFLQLRARSINEVIELSYKCHNEVAVSPEEFTKRFRRTPDEGEPLVASCDHVVNVKINLDNIFVTENPTHTKQIFLTETMGLNMRYPNYKTVKFAAGKEVGGGIQETLQSIAMCVESVFDAQSVYTNFTPKEIQEWVEKLTQVQFEKIQEFFETMPKLEANIPFHCPRCDYKDTIHLEGLASFFA